MSDRQSYRAATARAEAARVEFLSALGAARLRTSPDRIKAEAKEKAFGFFRELRDEARAQVTRRSPWVLGALGGAIVAWLFRKPIAALFCRLYVGLRERFGAQAPMEESDDGE